MHSRPGKTHTLDDPGAHTGTETVYNTSKHHPPGNGIMEYCPTENTLTGLTGGLDRRVAETRRDVAPRLTGQASSGNP